MFLMRVLPPLLLNKPGHACLSQQMAYLLGGICILALQHCQHSLHYYLVECMNRKSPKQHLAHFFFLFCLFVFAHKIRGQSIVHFHQTSRNKKHIKQRNLAAPINKCF